MAHNTQPFNGDFPMETIGDMLISPNTDIPFGKEFRMGLAIYTIYDKAIENGYNAGIEAHKQFL